MLNTTTNSPVANATVQLYSWSCYNCAPSDIAPAVGGLGLTDADGLLSLAPQAKHSARLAVLVTAPTGGAPPAAHGELVLLETSHTAPPKAEEKLRAVLLTDRALYRPRRARLERREGNVHVQQACAGTVARRESYRELRRATESYRELPRATESYGELRRATES